MLFNSFEFLIFFPLVTALYYALPHRFRWALLLAASCVFYMAFIPVYILILFVTILIDYFAGMWIEDSKDPRKKKIYLGASIVATCMVLFVFKYFNFFNSNISALAGFIGWNYPVSSLGIILPIGLSFHTFQSLSYVVEVYWNRQKAERNFGIYSLYVMFYPQLVAGPIERPQNLLHQFYEKHDFDYGNFTDGLKLMVWGMFKKVVIADRLAIFVNAVYNHPQSYEGLPLLMATVFFAIQIFCDFSGYSDIAIGAAQTMGFKLMTNFNRPYYAKSIDEFWRRWHISLSTWFKDYFYIPLGGSRVSDGRWRFNIFMTFMVSGLWHGANWTFVIWGALHGIYIITASLTAKLRKRVLNFTGLLKYPFVIKIANIVWTFILVDFAWIFFRANSVSDAFYVIANCLNFGGQLESAGAMAASLAGIDLTPLALVSVFISVLLMEAVHLTERSGSVRSLFNKKPVWFRWSVYYILLFWIIILGVFGQNQFIYFQF